MIETSGLTKRFDDITAVDHIDAKIKEGQRVRADRDEWRRKEHIFQDGQRDLKTGRGNRSDRRGERL